MLYLTASPSLERQPRSSRWRRGKEGRCSAFRPPSPTCLWRGGCCSTVSASLSPTSSLPASKERRSASDLLPASPSPGQSLTAGEGRRRAQATRPGLSVPPSIGTHLPVGRLREGVAQPFGFALAGARPRGGEVPLNLRLTRPVVALASLSPTSFPGRRGGVDRPLCLALIHLPVGKGGTVLLGFSVSSSHLAVGVGQGLSASLSTT